MKLFLKLPAIAVTVISWILSSRSTIPMPDFTASDKLVHLVCFAGLAFCWTLWFSPESWKKHPLRNIFIVIAIVAVYGIIDEYHQSFVPGRDPSLFDWIADVLGAGIGSLAGCIAMKVYRYSKQSHNESDSSITDR